LRLRFINRKKGGFVKLNVVFNGKKRLPKARKTTTMQGLHIYKQESA